MNDYFNQLVDTRGQLAGLHSLIDGYLKSLDQDDQLIKDTYIKLLQHEVVVVKEKLDKGIS
jgi:GTP-binding protein EngB required for normal cell division